MFAEVIGFFKSHIHLSRFIVVGGLNTLFDLVLFFLLANIAGISPVPASIVSTGLTMCLSFYLNHRFVFASSKRRRHTVIQFFAVTGFNVWLVQSLVIAFTVHLIRTREFFESHVWSMNLFAKICGIGVSFVLNFLMYRLIFNQKPVEELQVL